MAETTQALFPNSDGTQSIGSRQLTITRSWFKPSCLRLKDGIVHLDVECLTFEKRHAPTHGWACEASRLRATRRKKSYNFKVEGGVPQLDGLAPWERELLAPFVERLLDGLFPEAEASEDQTHAAEPIKEK